MSLSSNPCQKPRRRRTRAVPTAKTRDSDIRAVLLDELRLIYSEPDHDLILEEFGCHMARIDVAVVNGALHGFEIKSDSDTVDRLHTQIVEYGKIFDYITLVCGRRLLRHAKPLLPPWWGLQLADYDTGSVILKQIRTAKKNPTQDRAALARMLWKNEALSVLKKHGHAVLNTKHSAEVIWDEAARLLSKKTLADEAREAIKVRGGSGFAKPQAQDDGLCTTESIGTADHYSANLAWLLAQLSEHPLG